MSEGRADQPSLHKLEKELLPEHRQKSARTELTSPINKILEAYGKEDPLPLNMVLEIISPGPLFVEEKKPLINPAVSTAHERIE